MGADGADARTNGFVVFSYLDCGYSQQQSIQSCCGLLGRNAGGDLEVAKDGCFDDWVTLVVQDVLCGLPHLKMGAS